MSGGLVRRWRVVARPAGGEGGDMGWIAVDRAEAGDDRMSQRMPGPYAHLTLVQLLRSRLAAGAFPGLSAEARAAVARSTAFCELGAFGPDTSYFAMAQPGSARWGDLQHKGGAMRVLLLGARALRPIAPDERRRRLAWLLGYASHVVADAVVHPIIEHLVGDYTASRETYDRHRQAELHQDVFIYRQLGLDEVGKAAHMRAIAGQCRGAGGEVLDRGVAALWTRCLEGAYSERPAGHGPSPERWFAAFHGMIDLADESHHLTFLRGLLDHRGVVFPLLSEVNPAFVRGLWTPAGRQDYDVIFARVVEETGRMWVDVADAVAGDEAALVARPDLNLNTGKVIPAGFALWGPPA